MVQSDILRRQSHGKICSLYTSESSLFRKGTTRGCTSQDAHYTPQECNAGRLSGRLSGTQPLTVPLEVNQLLEKLCISLATPAPIEVSADPARARAREREREKEREGGREREVQLTVPELSIRVMRSAQLNELWQVWVQCGHTLLRHVVGCEELALDVDTHTHRGARGGSR